MAIGTVVTPYDITIYINSVDVTANVPLETINFDDYGTEPSTFNFRVENPSGVTPDFGQTVQVYWNSAPKAIQSRIFDGYVMNVRNAKYDNGILLQYDVECQDKKVLLQKSIIEFTDLSGSISDIVSGLFAAVYPDLSSLFDFTSGVDNFSTDFNFSANDENMLDKLKELAELGGLEFSVKTGGLTNTVTFDALGLGSPDDAITVTSINNKGDLLLDEDSSGIYTTQIESNGNPGNCYHVSGTRVAPNPGVTIRTWFNLAAIFGQDVTITGFSFDYKATTPDSLLSISVVFEDNLNNRIYEDLANSFTADGTWRSLTELNFDALPSAVSNQIYILLNGKAQDGAQELRIDNVAITIQENFGSGFGDKSRVDIGDPPDSEFDLDIDISDEFGFDIDLDIGDYGSNSITVTGGNEEVPIDWIYESDGTQDHFDLEIPIDSIVVYENVGSDTTPSWSPLASGQWGLNERTVDGGDRDALYDPENHWLYFNSNPPNLTKSFRVTGTIQKPVRVRMENIGAGDPTLAEAVYDESITSEAQAAAKASALLEKQSEVKRASFKTYNPGLKPGTKINIIDTNRGLNESLVIRHVSARWLGASGSAEFSIEAGPENYASLDRMFADTEKRLKPKPPPTALTTILYGLLIDADNDFVIDANDKGILVKN